MNFTQRLKSLKTLTQTSFKMYIRNRGAVFFTLLFPLTLMMVFGFLSNSSGPTLKIDITNESASKLSSYLIERLEAIPSMEIQVTPKEEARQALTKGDIDLQLIIPPDFGLKDPQSQSAQASTLLTYYNEAKPQNGQTANLILNQVVSGLNQQLNKTPQPLQIKAEGVTTHNLGYFDFILPGILSMTIMQLGIFGVAFAFVSLKASGALRRIQATPVHPRNFIVAQAITRLIIGLVSIGILMTLGILFFNFHMLGSYASFAVVAILGMIVFLGIGFGIAGWAKDENQVAPVANLVQLPMLLLSGIFFARDNFPGWLKTVTDYFPLTFLSDGLRQIANEGASLMQVGGNLLGLVLWAIVVFLIAIKVFRWE